MLDAYEADLEWIHYGQPVEFTTEAYPGKVFQSRISFIDPRLDDMTRTVKVRLDVPNEDGQLKPEMFVRAVIRSDVASGGRVMAPDLAGKWICPMHPNIIKDGPASCDICGMPLEKAEGLGYMTAAAVDQDKPLVIPASAPLITGARAVVYVDVPGAEMPTYEGRESVLGPRAGDFYVVQSGLEEGERVVVRGNFKIDSALQIQAKPSMMSAEDTTDAKAPKTKAAEPEAPAAFQEQLRGVYATGAGIAAALAGDDLAAVKETAGKTAAALGAVNMALLEGEAHMDWMGMLDALTKGTERIQAAQDLAAARTALPDWIAAFKAAVEQFGVSPGDPVYLVHCPMAFDNKGADWLQPGKEVLNPYYGAAMLNCGSIVRRLDIADAPEGAEHAHE
jgi:Cu(I)/Ag(I) efflux system membrane fusion protein